MPRAIPTGLQAGLVAGSLFGLADGVVAGLASEVPLGPGAWLGCLAGALLQYGLVAGLATGFLGLLLEPLLRRREAPARLALLLSLALAAGLFAELFWRTRPWVFYGHAAGSPERLGAAAAMLVVSAIVAWPLARLLAAGLARGGKALGIALALVMLGGGLYLLAQRGAIGARGAENERNRDLPNVLLVIVDALRADTLGCAGHPRARTPHIDRLAAEGVRFENAFVQAPFTWTSFGSLLTGKYPRRHGLMKMAPGVAMVPNVTLPMHLKSATRRDGPALRDEDWVAATFHTGTLTASSGLLGGFDQRFEATAGRDLVVLDSAWSVFRSNLLLWILANKVGQKLELSGTAEEARGWMAELGDRRFFAMVHLYSTHTPYDPPAEFRALYCDPAYAGPVGAFWAAHRQLIETGRYVPTPADVAQIGNLYLAGVSQADAHIGALVEELRARGVLDRTLVIVTADHGESLGEQGLWEHNHMVQTNLRVPLLMRLPGALPAGRSVDALVDQIDVFPTVCDLLGLELPEVRDGKYDRVDGASLLPLVRGEAQAVREHSFAENGLFSSIQDRRHKLVVPAEALSGADPAPAGARLVDLVEDPQELRDVSGEQRTRVNELLAALRAWSAGLPLARHDVVRSHRDEEHLFENLGYAGREGEERPRKPGP